MIIRLILTVTCLYAAAHAFEDVVISNHWAAIGAACVIGLLNFLVKPIVKLISFPLILLSLGLFLMVINGGLLLVASEMVNGLEIGSYQSAILLSIPLSFAHALAPR